MGMKPVNAGVPAGGVTRERARAAADFLKLFAHTSRLLIVCSLIEGERSVGELEASLGIRQPALSQQLAELREAGIVEGRRDAKQVFYRIADHRALALISMLHGQFCGGKTAAPAVARSTATSISQAGSPAVPPRRIVVPAEAARFARIERPGASERNNG